MAGVIQQGKRTLIDKANSSMVITLAVAGFLVVFSLIASRALLVQRSHQSRVITEKQTAKDQLDANLQAVQKLAVSYREFVSTPDNVIGGNPQGTGDRDGDNAKIVLDALPSKYDFPAFVTGMEKLLLSQNINVSSISGTDDEIAQSIVSDNPMPVEIPFNVETQVSSYANVQSMLTTLQRSIRPIKVQSIQISGGDGQLSVGAKAVSYYQGEKGLTIQKKAVK